MKASQGRTYYLRSILLLVSALLWMGCSASCWSGWDVAYTARFYYPPGGKRISHQQVYLSDLRGHRRKQITFGAAECSQARWVGRNRLTWLKSVGGSTVRQELNIRTWNVKTVSGASDAASGIKPRCNTAQRPIYQAKRLDTGGEIWHAPGQPLVRWLHYDGLPFPRKLPYVTEDAPGKNVIARLGREYILDIPGDLDYMLPGKKPEHTWVISDLGYAEAGSFEWLFDVDWRTGKARGVADDVREIDFDPNGKYFTALEGGRDMGNYGSRRRVWTSRIYAGSLVTGRKWAIVPSLVLGESVALRPLR